MTLVIALTKPAGQVITDTLSDVNSGVLGMLAYQSASGVPPNIIIIIIIINEND